MLKSGKIRALIGKQVVYMGVFFVFLFTPILPTVTQVEARTIPNIPSYTEYKEGEVIIKFKDDQINFEKRKNLDGLADLQIKKGIILKKIHAFQNSATFKSNKYTTKELIEKLKKDKSVEYVEPNFILKKAATPNDPGFPSQWALNNTGQNILGINGLADADIDALEAWGLHTNSSTMKIAIIDGGVALNHPDLKPYFIDPVDYADNDWIPEAEDAHATHIAGIIGAIGNNSNGVTGVNWNVKIIPIKMDFTVDQAIDSINYALDNGAKIINCSWTSPNYSFALYSALYDAWLEDVLVVAAAGNEGENNELTHSYPSDYDLGNIISVAATNNQDQLADFSNYGSTSVDVAAPGVGIYSTTHISDLMKRSQNPILPLLMAPHF